LRAAGREKGDACMRNKRRGDGPPAAGDRGPVTPGSVLHRLMVLVAGEMARQPEPDGRRPAPRATKKRGGARKPAPEAGGGNGT
jgi:hypothetical protein